MQVKVNRLSDHLQGGLAPVYLVSGDEMLLVEESCDAILQAAHKAGFTDRSVHHVDGNFSWDNLSQDAASMSLFAERKILDVRLTPKQFGRETSAALRAWVESAQGSGDDTILLLRTARLDAGQRKSAWFKALENAGVVVLIWGMSGNELLRWLRERLGQQGLKAEDEALQYLQDRVEGNLLAAMQEIRKLALLDLPQPITASSLVSALEDASRFNSFDLLEAVMVGRSDRVTHILHNLREEGTAVFAILGAFTSQLRRLLEQPPNLRGMPPESARALETFGRRIRDVLPVLAECAIVDQQGKGQKPGDAWVSLERLLVRLSGQRQFSLPSQDLKLLQDQAPGKPA